MPKAPAILSPVPLLASTLVLLARVGDWMKGDTFGRVESIGNGKGDGRIDDGRTDNADQVSLLQWHRGLSLTQRGDRHDGGNLFSRAVYRRATFVFYPLPDSPMIQDFANVAALRAGSGSPSGTAPLSRLITTMFSYHASGSLS